MSKDNMQTLIGQLNDLNNGSGAFRILEDLADNIDDPAYQGPSFQDLFGLEDGSLDVYGNRLPSSIEGLAEERIATDWLKGPVRAIATNKKRLVKMLEQLTKAEADFEKRVVRRSKALVRKMKGGAAEVRNFLNTIAVQDLQPFAAGEPKNRLVFAKRTSIHLGVELPTQVIDLDDELSVFDQPNDAAALQPLLHDTIRRFADTVLDHSASFGMTVGTVTGNDKVDRELALALVVNYQGSYYRVTYRAFNTGKPKIQDAVPYTASASADLQLPEENTAMVSGFLDYSFKVAKTKIAEVLEYLQFVSGLPLFRGLSPDLVADDLLTDEDDGELWDETEEATVAAPADEDDLEVEAYEAAEAFTAAVEEAGEEEPAVEAVETVEEIVEAQEEEQPAPPPAYDITDDLFDFSMN